MTPRTEPETRTAESVLERLERLAAAATAGPWEHYTDQLRPGSKVTVNEVQVPEAPPIVQWMGFDDSDRPKAQHTANAAYIAAASPDVVSALVAAVRRAERFIASVRAGPGWDGWMTLEEEELEKSLQALQVAPEREVSG